MCGLCGIINFNGEPARSDQLEKMMVRMKHRGPDDEGWFFDQNVALGHVRLSIIDLSDAGHQPMLSPDKRYVVAYNGEIFNYIELRNELKSFGYTFRTNTDTEVLLYAYQKWGESCIERFNGMWAFVIYDRKMRTIFFSRDRFGIKPFYYYLTPDLFAFASEIPPLLSIMPYRPTPDYQSIFDFLVFNRTDQTQKTFFYEIKKLQHGHFLKIELLNDAPRHISIKKWYNLKERINYCSGFSNPEEYSALFKSSIELRLRCDVPLGVCLSGGLDSSSIVSVLLKNFKREDLNTFSAIYKPNQHGDESPFIDLFRPKIKNMYHVKPTAETLLTDIESFIKAHAEPTPTAAPYAQFKVMELAKNHVTVTLDGQGADEELAGYHYFFGFFFKDLLRQLRMPRLFSEMTYYGLIHKSFYGYKSFMYFLAPQSLRTCFSARAKGYISKDLYNKYARDTKIGGELYGSKSLQDALLNHFEYKLEHLLKWEDRNSMRFSLEARVPFLDYRLVEKTLSTQSDWIINKGMNKYILRKSMSDILPSQIKERVDKVGFGTPQDEWLRTPAFRKYILEIINSDSFRSRDILDTQKATHILKSQLKDPRADASELWKCLTLENWFRFFID